MAAVSMRAAAPARGGCAARRAAPRAQAAGRPGGARGRRVAAVAAPAQEPDAAEMISVVGIGAPKVDLGDTSTLTMRIDGQWYDVSGWAKAHPGGAMFIKLMNGRDATSVFYALHSNGANGADEAVRRLAKLPKCDPPAAERQFLPDAETARACKDFAEFREKLEKDGWFERVWWQEAQILVRTLALYVGGQLAANAGHPVLAACLLGVGMEQAGWLAHDYVHGRGKWCTAMRNFGALTNGFSGEWWSYKHNMHHSFTNVDGCDDDIMSEPFLYLQSPKETGRPDPNPLRRFQHIYGYPLYSVTFLMWRLDSVIFAWNRKDKGELAALALQYIWLFGCLPLPVAISSVLLGGFLCGSIVSATHQSEEIMTDRGEYVDMQFRSTRDAACGPWWETMLWGGMDVQLEHHLFPTMPRYKLHKLRPLLQAWAEGQDTLEYRISSTTDIIKQNFKLLYRVGQA